MYIPHFSIFSSVYGHLGCSLILAIMNNAAMNMGVQTYLQDPNFNYFWIYMRSGIVESHGSSIFNFLW